MEHDTALENLRSYVDGLQQSGADRNTVELGQKLLDVLDWFEARLDFLDDRESV